MSDNLNLFNCDICQENQPIRLDMLNKYNDNQNISVCGNCGFVYVPYRRTSEEIATSWNDDLFQKSYTAKIPYVLARLTYVHGYIMDTIGLDGKSLCDIGAGEGVFLDICKRDTKEVSLFGVEPSEFNCNIMEKNNHPNFLGTIEEYRENPKFADRKFDIVTIMWTLEACFGCKEMMQIAHDMLNDDGVVVVATGSRLMVPYKKNLTDYLGPNPADTHSFRFSPNSLGNLMKVTGFKPEGINRYHDGEFLVSVGRKTDLNQKAGTHNLKKDDPKLVCEFFERWDHETQWFQSKKLAENNV